MKKYFTVLLIILSTTSIQTGYRAQDIAQHDPGLVSRDRADLVVPDEIWNMVLDNTGNPGGTIGYSADEMDHYKSSDCILPAVEGYFRNITTLPQSSGRLSGYLLADPSDFAQATTVAYRYLDARGGRGIETPGTDDWGVDWIDAGANIDDALQAVLDQRHDGYQACLLNDQWSRWRIYPLPVRKLIVRLLIAYIETQPILDEAFDEQFYKDYFDAHYPDNITPKELYEFASAPWSDDIEYPVPRESFEALNKLDRNYLGYASVNLMFYTRAALIEFLECDMPDDLPGSTFSIPTPVGDIAIFGTGDNEIEGDYALVLDLGGNDSYSGRTAVPLSFSKMISMVIDLDGNDVYTSQESASLACGNHGIGAIFDLDGDDSYSSADSGIGCGWYGTGMVVDFKGDDSYSTDRAWGQGAAHAGVGILIDVEGDDDFYCMEQSQAFGSTYGVGVLIDGSGNDNYLADLEANLGTAFGDHTVSFAQGTGYGRRADFGDGHSLGGGIGILADGSGDDTYTGGVYCQGAGYWWALGICEDRAGNDTYTNDWYSLGSAPHFALGCCVDLEGDDIYNLGNENLMCQTQGCGRDGSIAVFIDGAGNDIYSHSNRCAGSGDLNSIAMFWDRMGNDSYTNDRNKAYYLDRSYGDATFYPPFNSFRDTVNTIGIFLDTGGDDIYTEVFWEIPESEEGVDPTEPPLNLEFGNDIEWRHRDGSVLWGYGLDIDWFNGFIEDEGSFE